jgi:hypothetical protein
MTTIEKIPEAIFFYWAAVLIVFTLLYIFGRQVTQWLFTKLYEFFIAQ